MHKRRGNPEAKTRRRRVRRVRECQHLYGSSISDTNCDVGMTENDHANARFDWQTRRLFSASEVVCLPKGHRAKAWCKGGFLPPAALAELKEITKLLKACDPRDERDWVQSSEGDVSRPMWPLSQSVDQSATKTLGSIYQLCRSRQ